MRHRSNYWLSRNRDIQTLSKSNNSKFWPSHSSWEIERPTEKGVQMSNKRLHTPHRSPQVGASPALHPQNTPMGLRKNSHNLSKPRILSLGPRNSISCPWFLRYRVLWCSRLPSLSIRRRWISWLVLRGEIWKMRGGSKLRDVNLALKRAWDGKKRSREYWEHGRFLGPSTLLLYLLLFDHAIWFGDDGLFVRGEVDGGSFGRLALVLGAFLRPLIYLDQRIQGKKRNLRIEKKNR
jgi:hypothetical protein